MPKVEKYPHAVDCYRLVAREGQPPRPERQPVATEVVHSQEEAKRAKAQLKQRYPGGWCVERPLDWE